MTVTGLVLVDKPVGPTSFAVLRDLRPVLGRKLGHAGTLDPFASGLLLVLAGGATRLATYLSGLDKSYRAVVQFGASSSTLDPEGDVLPTGRRTDRQACLRAAAAMTGTITQRVPVASAVRVDGERSYARMRRGEPVEPSPRTVRIEALDVESFDDPTQRATIRVRCSKGTYVRQIAADMGEATGAGAFCLELRRLGVGGFDAGEAGSPAEIAADPAGPWFRHPLDAVPHLGMRDLSEAERDDVVHGRALRPGGERGPTRLVHSGRLVAIGEPRAGLLRPVVVLVP